MNFCFVLDDLLAASSQPGKNRRVQDYLTLFRENNIKVLVSLYRRIELPKTWESEFTTYHYRLDDTELPSTELLDEIVNIVVGHMKKREPVNVNDAAGIRSSGLVCIAAMMKFLDIDYATAFHRVSEQRYAIEEDDIVSLMKDYERLLVKQRNASRALR